MTGTPALTMADDRGAKLSVLPMGSLFETAQMLAFELAILKLRRVFTRRPKRCRPAREPGISGLRKIACD
jgi:6-phospho-3-hexuloisomerase